MAGCCPAAPTAAAPATGSRQAGGGRESRILAGENVDCYANRAGDMTGLQDDATDTPEGAIATTTIALNAAGATNTQFEMTPGSPAVTWTMEFLGAPVSSVGGVPFTSSGLFAGTFNPAVRGQQLDVKVKAWAGSTLVDSRSYTFSPSPGGEDTYVKLRSPLPGAVVTSRYGPRVHPVTGANKAHTGIDMAYADRSTREVVAAADGEVVMVDAEGAGGYGKRVHVRHLSGSGQHVLTTTYNHLAQVLCQRGQKVMAGQAIGVEGNTGTSTGAHLHFECRLPSGSFIDPEPLINGTTQVATATRPDNTPAPGSVVTKTSDAVLTQDDARARSLSCEPFGPEYPDDKPDPPPDAPPSGPDPFETAFNLTMHYEVGGFWAPTDPDVIAGNDSTAAQRRKVGYVDDSLDKGGLTKYGVAQKANPKVKVEDLDLETAKLIYYNSYWKKSNADDMALRVACAHFDAAVNHGVGRANQIAAGSGASSLPVGATPAQQMAVVQRMAAARRQLYADIVARNPSQARFTNGWNSRVDQLVAALGAL